jgi:glutathione S-transferase
LKLHWSPRSPYVRKVMVFAHETGLAPRIEIIRSMVEMTNPNRVLMRDNPLGKIPTLIADDGRIFYESVVICEYLDTLHDGAKFFPSDVDPRWQALRWHGLANGLIDALILWRNERSKPEPRRTPELLQAFEIKTRATLLALEGEMPALAEFPLGIAQVTLGCLLGYLDYRFPYLGWRNGHDRLAGWFTTFNARPSMQATVPHD